MIKARCLEALELAKKFYDEQLRGEEHKDEELIRYYALEEQIATDYPNRAPMGLLDCWCGAICWLKDIIKFQL